MADTEATTSQNRKWSTAGLGLLVAASLAACGEPTTPTEVAVTGVTLDRSTLSLTVGGSSTTLVATVAPASATNSLVTWSSSDAAVAAVNAQGVVSPVAPGTATITVQTQDGAKTATCAVTVVAATVAVTSLSLDKTSLNLVAGAAPVKLVATITPTNATSKTVLWQSSNAAVATVSDSGSVTPLAPGTASIVAKTADGSKSATCVVTVTAGPVRVTGVTLGRTTLALTVGSAAPALVATVSPANASDRATSWSSDKPAVASVDASGVVTGRGEGTAVITVTTHDGSFTAACSVTVTVPANAVTGVTIDVEQLDLVVGASTGTLTASVAPANADNRSVTWSSSDVAVAKVSETGVVTAVASGTATITVTTAEGAFTDTSAITVHSDAVTQATVSYPVTGQIALTWADPLDLNATGIRVTMGAVSRLIPIGTKRADFVGLEVGAAQTLAIRVVGASGTTSDQVTTVATPIKVVKLLRWAMDSKMVVTDTFGSSATETHDLVMANGAEVPTEPSFPKNYRWVLMPGLADPTDPTLVSLKSQEYLRTTAPDGGTSSEWVETERYINIHPGGVADQGQFYNWCKNTPPAIMHVAYADTIDTTSADAKTASTFKMVSRSVVEGAVGFQWLGDSSGGSYLVDDCYHIVAQDAATVGENASRPFTFEQSTAWLLDDVATLTP